MPQSRTANQRTQAQARTAAAKAKKAKAEVVPPIFDVTVDGERYVVHESLITWFHEQALDDATRGVGQKVGLTPRKILARLRGDDYNQVVLAGIVFLSRLQSLQDGETVSFLEVANEIGDGYQMDKVIIGPPPEVEGAEDDDRGEAPGGDS